MLRSILPTTIHWTNSFICSLIHPFTQQIFTEYQLCAKHCERPEEYRHDLKIQAEIKRSEDITKVRGRLSEMVTLALKDEREAAW